MLALAKKSFICLLLAVGSILLMSYCWLTQTQYSWTFRQKERSSHDNFSINEEFTTERPTMSPTFLSNENKNVSESLSKQTLLSQDIMNEMQECSVNMGVSIETLKNKAKLGSIANKAAIFLLAFWEVIPQPSEYLKHTKNPCWYSNITVDKASAQDISNSLGQYRNLISKAKIPQLYKGIFDSSSSQSRLYCLPYFFIAGFPKSGTTSLHVALSKHPQIMPPGEKELHWWARVPLKNTDKKYLKIVALKYRLNFIKASESIQQNNDFITYDGSQSTLVDSNFGISDQDISDQDYCAMAAVVHKVLPDLKLIFIMRDPVERLLSHFYYMHNSKGWPTEMKKNSKLYFNESVKAAIEDFDSCRTTHSLFECANQQSQRKRLTTWLGVGIYYIQILEWLQFWPKQNFQFLKIEDLSREPVTVMNKITQFLGLDSVSESESRQWFSKIVNVHGHTETMLPQTREILEHFYEPYNTLLDNFLKKGNVSQTI